MIEYQRQVHYYETDKMSITHHSNYIRWMEEARTYFLSRIGIPFSELEAAGFLSPVISVNVEYKSPTAFDDKIAIEVFVSKYTGVRLEFTYTIKNMSSGKIAALGVSQHCFTKNGHPCSLAHSGERFDTALKNAVAAK